MEKSNHADETLLTKREAASRAHRHSRTIEHWVQAGKLPVAYNDGLRVFFRPEDIDRCLEILPRPPGVTGSYLTGEQRASAAAKAAAEYESGSSIRQIAVKLKINEGVARNLLTEAGVQLRQQTSKKQVYIYALVDENGQDRYVGHTVRDPERRSWAHWDDAHKPPSPGSRHINNDMIRWLHTLERRPDYRILDTVPYEERLTAEEKWTVQLLAEGASLLNHNAGAKQKLTELGKKSCAIRNRGNRTMTAEARKAMSERAQAWWNTRTEKEREEHRAKSVNAHKPSKEAREQLAEQSRARWADPATRARMMAGMRKAKRNPARGNYQQAQKKKWQDPEYREKQLAGIRKKYSCECGKELPPGPMGRHLKSSKHRLLMGEIGNSKTSKWRRTGSTVDLSQALGREKIWRSLRD